MADGQVMTMPAQEAPKAGKNMTAKVMMLETHFIPSKCGQNISKAWINAPKAANPNEIPIVQ